MESQRCARHTPRAQRAPPNFEHAKGPVTLPKIRVNAWITHKFRVLCPCSTGRRRHCARTAYEKMNRSPRWFGGTFPALLFRMCCVSTAYQWRMGGAHAAHMAHEWQCYCVWRRAWEPDNCVSTAQVAYAQRTAYVRAPINAILRRMAGVCTAYGLRTCRTYKYSPFFFAESFYLRGGKGENCECDRESKCHALIQSADEEAEGEIRRHKTRPLLMRHRFGLQFRCMHPMTRTSRVMLKTL